MSHSGLEEPALWTRYTQEGGRVHLTGLEALVRLPIEQVRADRAAGRRVAALISGYPGSPVAGLDRTLDALRPLLERHDVRLEHGLNEELAAGIVGGTQLLDLFPHSRYDGVLGIWFGKAPGLDRALDAIRHANFMGTSRFGAALAIVGDDPSCKSSSIPSHSEHAAAHAMMPLFAPSDALDALELGRLAFGLSRYAGLWVALKITTDIADGGGIFELPKIRPEPALPKFRIGDPESGHAFQKRFDPRLLPPHVNEIERALFYERLEAARRYVYANEIDRIEVRGPRDGIGLVASGRLIRELRTALERLGLDDFALRERGIRLMSIRATWPLEPRRLREFADGLDELVVVDERRGFLEEQLRAVLFNEIDHPRVLGQFRETGAPWLARHREVTAETLAIDLGHYLAERQASPELGERAARLQARTRATEREISLARAPHFCSGCPHSNSTRLPEGAVAGGGIGCHTMALLMDRQVRFIGAMGSEGSPWIGLAPYCDTPHLFQNLGDGTYFHSGRLAVRAAVEAATNVTYKILYNSAVGMTGGQRPVGIKSVSELVRDLLSDGVRKVVAVSNDAELRELSAADDRVECVEREDWSDAQLRIAREAGVTALVYDQLCANQKQRLERRGILAKPAKRIEINADVCEGCGDCLSLSTCSALVPVNTPLGRKTRVNATLCSDDRSCLSGDCPAFLEVTTPRVADASPERWIAGKLPEPEQRPWERDRFEIYMVGIGSTGVVSANALILRAAEHEGLFALHLDQTGLAQRGGKVVSHTILTREAALGSPRVGWGRADSVLAFDPIGASDEQGLLQLDPRRSLAIVHARITPTAAMIESPELDIPEVRTFAEALRRHTRELVEAPAEELAEALFGETLAANVILLGVAVQSGAFPVSAANFERAIRDRGIAVESNLIAFGLGRSLSLDPGLADRILADARPPSIGDAGDPDRARELLDQDWARFESALSRFEASPVRDTLLRRTADFATDLVDYQNRAYAARYLAVLGPLAEAEAACHPHAPILTEIAAREFYRMSAIKDEYEVARLHLRGPFRRWLERHSEGRLRLRYLLHPPLLRRIGLRRKLALARSFEPGLWLLVALRSIRGSWLDPFGHTRTRRQERAQTRWYAEILARLTLILRADAHADALDIARAAEALRGYEQIRLGREGRIREQVEAALAQLEATQP